MAYMPIVNREEKPATASLIVTYKTQSSLT